MIEVLIDKCVGCGACLLACAYDAIKIEDKIAVKTRTNVFYAVPVFLLVF